MKKGQKRKIVVVVGGTASGKTRLGVILAKKFNGEIVSADSRQVYRGLDIGTGKDLKEYDNIIHHLIDVCDPEQKFTMFDWLELAKKSIESIFEKGKAPIVVGGTGLYVQALIEGFLLEKTNNSKLITNNYGRGTLDSKTKEELRVILKEFDSVAYEKIDTNNLRRLIRAIERAQSGERATKIKPNFEAIQIGVNTPREELYQKIDQRVDQWFADGIMGEVNDLISKGVDPNWLKSIGLEYRIIAQYLQDKPQDVRPSGAHEGLIKQEIKNKNHGYARRQMTWFRRFPEINWISNNREAEKLVEKFLC